MIGNHNKDAVREKSERDGSIYTTIEAVGLKAPDQIVLSDERGNCTWRELLDQVGQFARYLLSQGLRHEEPIGVYLPRQRDLIVALLGIWKAGGVYLPLDPSYPRKRIGYMVEDARLRFVVTTDELVSRLPSRPPLRVLSVTASNSQDSAAFPVQYPVVRAQDLAYIIYTSGSTGQPKGVMIQHGGVVNMSEGQRTVFQLTIRDRVALFASISFDASIWSIVMALRSGAQLMLNRSAALLPGRPLCETLKDEKITCVTLPPSVLSEMPYEALPDLRTLVVAGESCPVELMKYWSAGRQFYNAYGPTESSVWATISACSPNQETITIGRAIPRMQALVLDSNRRLVGPGEVGELALCGVGLARGYLHQEALTRERFVELSLPDSDVKRVYLTGDRVRERASGELEFLGRMDEQIKWHGFRIEPGEIEGALHSHPSIKRVAVIMHRDHKSAGDRLVAYLLLHEPMPDLAQQLKSFLGERLPSHMVPAAFVCLEQFPELPNGKLDRERLPLPDNRAFALSNAYVPPISVLQSGLCKIWSELLKISRVGIRDSFFELGGDSLSATRLLARIETTWSIRVPYTILYQHPEVEGLSSWIEEIQSGDNSRHTLKPPILKQLSATADHALSYAQERLWFLDQLSPGMNAYNIPSVITFRGALSVPLLEQSVKALLKKHRVLRSRFRNHKGTPFVEYVEVDDIQWEEESLLTIPAAQLDEICEHRIQQAAESPFDLAEGPLLRFKLFHVKPQEWRLLMLVHHIVYDGWSSSIFLRDLSNAYNQTEAAQESVHQASAVTYLDYAVWQRGWQAGGVVDEVTNYWIKKLGGASFKFDLPSKALRVKQQTYNGERIATSIDKRLTHRLSQLSREDGVTLFTLLLSAFRVLLFRYTGERDVLVGAPEAGRPDPALDQVVGYFLNTLVLRTPLEGTWSFRQLVEQVHLTVLEAKEHQDVPFEKIVEALNPERDLSRHPLYQVMFNLLNYPRYDADFTDLDVVIDERPPVGSKLDLTVYAREVKQQLVFEVIYNPDLFDYRQMEEFLEHFTKLLAEVVENQDLPLTAYNLLSSENRHLRNTQTNEFRLEHPFQTFLEEEIEQSIATRFEKQVALRPDEVAVVYNAESITYAELNRRANGVAMALLHEENGSGRIGLLCDPGIDQVVAMLGALKAGKLYVPLDPDVPDARNQFIARDADITVLLCDDAKVNQADRIASQAVQTMTLKNVDGPLIKDVELPVVPPDAPAYLIYTSGSTGQPKGVLQNQRNVLHHIRVYTNQLHLSSTDRVSQTAYYCFDASVMDVFGALLNGAELFVFDTRRKSPAELQQFIIQNKITVFHATPTVFRHYIADEFVPMFPDLRALVLGGESVTRDDVELFGRKFTSDAILVNGYGPTESTMAMQYFLQNPGEVAYNGSLPIGYPVPHTEISLMNRAGEQVALYGLGEIVISNPFVALGYWNNSELTHRKFSDGTYAGSRKYYSGDIGRRRPDGAIEYVGRLDDQVKIRGHRIELNEVELAALNIPETQEAAAKVFRNEYEEIEIVLYVRLAPNSQRTSGDIRAALAETLPAYMVPITVEVLPAFPMTMTGKIDRKKLPAPNREFIRPLNSGTAPTDDVEVTLLKIWSDVLKIKHSSVHDNFFEVGGHSLMAVRLFSEIEQGLGVQLPLSCLFSAPTVSQLAACIRQPVADKIRSRAVAIQVAGERNPFFCVHGIGGEVLEMHAFSQHLGLDQPFYGLQAMEEDVSGAEPLSIEDLAARYIMDLKLVQPEGPYSIGGFCFGGIIAFEMAIQLSNAGDEIEILAILDTVTPPGYKSSLMGHLKNGWSVFTQPPCLKWQRIKKLSTRAQRVFKQKMGFHQEGADPLRLQIRKQLLTARAEYIPSVFNGPICVFHASLDRKLGTIQEGWSACTSKKVTFIPICCTHQTLLSEPGVQELADQLKKVMSEKVFSPTPRD